LRAFVAEFENGGNQMILGGFMRAKPIGLA